MIYRSSKRAFSLLALLLVFALVLAACGGGDEATATPAAQEQPTTAPTDTPAPTNTPAAVDTPAVDTTAPLTETATMTETAPVSETTPMTETTAMTETVPMTETTPLTETAPVSETALVSETAAPAASPAVASTFVIDQSQSEARFTLDEKLMGQPKTVVGVTALIEGSITVDPSDLSKTTISAIQIDARDFTTDSNMRNNAIRRFVLQSNSDEFRYIVFTPMALEGLPVSGQAGDSLTFQISGDLTISGVTQPVTFETTVTADSATQLSGLAKTQVLRSDFNLTIPNVPSVADVTDEVQLELQFVALAQ